MPTAAAAPTPKCRGAARWRDLAHQFLQLRLQRILQLRRRVRIDQLDERRNPREARRGQDQIVGRPE
jgi:hypothetical protein